MIFKQLPYQNGLITTNDVNLDEQTGDFSLEAFVEALQTETECSIGALKKDHTKEITGSELLSRDVKEQPCLVEPFLQQIGIACIAGSSDTGKSSILRQLTVDIVTEKEAFLGFKLNTVHKSAIYVSTEDDEQATAFLLQKQAGTHSPEALKNLRFIFNTTDLLGTLKESLTAKPADIVIIDCFADILGSDLKDTHKIRSCLHPYQQLAQEHKCLFLFLHHTGKRTEALEPSKHNLLSGQGLEAKMRLVIELRLDQMNPNHRHLCIVKGNYLPTAYKKESFILHFDEQTFHFRNTGDRMPFELLSKQPHEDTGKVKYEKAVELKQEGKTMEQIAEAIGFASKGSVSKLFDRAKKRGWEKQDA